MFAVYVFFRACGVLHIFGAISDWSNALLTFCCDQLSLQGDIVLVLQQSLGPNIIGFQILLLPSSGGNIDEVAAFSVICRKSGMKY